MSYGSPACCPSPSSVQARNDGIMKVGAVVTTEPLHPADALASSVVYTLISSRFRSRLSIHVPRTSPTVSPLSHLASVALTSAHLCLPWDWMPRGMTGDLELAAAFLLESR